MALSNPGPVSAMFEESYVAGPRTVAMLALAFGAAGLLLAATGLFGVISNSVSSRTAEFGIRLALGAAPSDVQGLVLRHGMRLLLIGVAIGVAGSLIGGRFLASILFETPPWSPITYSAVVAMLVAAGLLAAWLPARRATQVDPVIALRG